MNGPTLVQRMEERSRLHPDRVVRLRGVVGEDLFELLIFRGFSSSTTHSTAFDPDTSVLPPGTEITSAELLRGPLGSVQDQPLKGPMLAIDLLKLDTWV